MNMLPIHSESKRREKWADKQRRQQRQTVKFIGQAGRFIKCLEQAVNGKKISVNQEG